MRGTGGSNPSLRNETFRQLNGGQHQQVKKFSSKQKKRCKSQIYNAFILSKLRS